MAFKVTPLIRADRISEAPDRRGPINWQIRGNASGRAPIIGQDNEDQWRRSAAERGKEGGKEGDKEGGGGRENARALHLIR